MQITLGQLRLLQRALSELVDPAKFEPKSAIFVFKLRSIVGKLQPQLEALETANNSLVDKYATKDELGRPKIDERGEVLFDSEEVELAATAALNELLSQTVELDTMTKLSAEDFEKAQVVPTWELLNALTPVLEL